jgi:hypothetical protein
MTYKIVPSSEELLPAVAAMNARMEAGGSRWKFYDTDIPDWLPPAPGATAWREFFLLVDESNGAVRGGFGLKYEQFQLNGEMVQLGWLQGPVAESAVDKSLKGLGSMMIKESLRRFPMQISWGANSIAAPSAGSAPMLLHIVNKGAFLKHAPILGEKPWAWAKRDSAWLNSRSLGCRRGPADTRRRRSPSSAGGPTKSGKPPRTNIA